VNRYGGLPSVDELARLRKTDVSALLPGAQFKYRREFEAPAIAEGFARVDIEPFVRRRSPEFTNAAVVVACDDPIDLAQIAAALSQYRDAGYRLLGIAWQPAIEEGRTSLADVKESFASECERLGIEMDVEVCPHVAGPPKCWCRKPLPGLGVVLMHRYRLDPGRCIYLGSSPHDAGLARRLGFSFVSKGDPIAGSVP
jgi:hypothetical protein